MYIATFSKEFPYKHT